MYLNTTKMGYIEEDTTATDVYKELIKGDRLNEILLEPNSDLMKNSYNEVDGYKRFKVPIYMATV